jgi:hypothetical protein
MQVLPRSLVTRMIIAFLALAGVRGVEAGTPPTPKRLSADAKLFVAPMEWNLDEQIQTEVRRRALPLRLVARREDADFIMTASSVKLGSRLLSPDRDFQVQIVAVDRGTQVWSAEVSDYATFFGRLRSHGSSRAAKSIVRKMRNRFFTPAR